MRIFERRAGALALAALLCGALSFGAQDGDWIAYGRDPGGERFSPLDAIRRGNVSSLQVAWTFRTGDAYVAGGANAWSVIVTDPARNLVFVPTSSPSHDYYGGERLGDNLFSDSVAALRGDTGARVWHFQTVHHDLWDYDVASPPILFDWRKDGRTIAAVGVASKTGHFFILNRETGVPLIPVEERAVPVSDVPGEVASPTQPFPVAPRALAPTTLKGGE